jgi:(p)ppGpp synthase/HD superfamily hydrolase
LANLSQSIEGDLTMSIQTIEDAIAFAAQKHKGQKDKNGAAYIYHPLNVMRRLDTDEERIVGVLHDVIEDCGVTLANLRELGYSDAVVEALDFLSKRPEEGGIYYAFIDRIRQGPVLAIKVKLADLADNMDPTRRTEDNEKTRERQAKYQIAVDMLTEALRLKIE